MLSLNMVSDMEHLPQVRTAASSLSAIADFQPGARYTDFNSSTDKAAGYGLAGLVAGGIGLAVAKKIGMLGLILAFGKKFLVLLLAGGAAMMTRLRRLFRRRGPE